MLLFSERMVCFLSKGFSQSGQVFSFLKGCGFFFFKCFCFCCFCKTQGLFFFKMVELYQKKKKRSFLQCFGRERSFFFFKKTKMVVFLQSVSFFQDFCFFKNHMFFFCYLVVLLSTNRFSS